MLVPCLLLAVGVGCSKKEAPPPPRRKCRQRQSCKRTCRFTSSWSAPHLGSQDIEIRARVEGYLASVNFTEGSFVKKGQLLYKIDPQPHASSIGSSPGQPSDCCERRLDKTNNDVNALQTLAEQQAVSQQELDNAVSAQQAAQSQVYGLRCSRLPRPNSILAYTTITSPVDGLIGTTQKKVGSLGRAR